jgi:hypothetical protein
VAREHHTVTGRQSCGLKASKQTRSHGGAPQHRRFNTAHRPRRGRGEEGCGGAHIGSVVLSWPAWGRRVTWCSGARRRRPYSVPSPLRPRVAPSNGLALVLVCLGSGASAATRRPVRTSPSHHTPLFSPSSFLRWRNWRGENPNASRPVGGTWPPGCRRSQSGTRARGVTRSGWLARRIS